MILRSTGQAATLRLTPFEVAHGRIDALGFRVSDVAYLPDVSAIPDAVWDKLQKLDCWIVDALRREPHPTHSHLGQYAGMDRTGQPRKAS